MDDRRAGLLLAAILAVVAASVLWTVAMPAPHTGGDNAAYLSLAQSLATGNGYTELWDPATPPHTKYPPGLPLLMSVLVAAGVSAWAPFKLLSAALVFGAVMMAYAWASRSAGVLLGGGVAAATLLAAGWLQASRWILSEPLFLFLLFVSFWALEPRSGERAPARGGLRTAVGCVAAGLAVFTRTAALPLIPAVLGVLWYTGRRRAALWFGGGLALPGLWWLGRALRGGEGAYQSEFWLVDPYQPELGTIGMLDLPVRVVRNLATYVGSVIPSEWWGAAAPFAGAGVRWALGVVLVGLAAWGWLLRARSRAGAPELFAPPYVGLLLVWPETWAGDRFSLPLYPLLLLYAVTALGAAAAMVPATRRALARSSACAAAFLLLAAPAVPGWLALSEQSSACRRVAEAEGRPLACNAVPFQEMAAAAAWTGENLRSDAVILSRKPRLFYALGGPRGRTFPFTQNPQLFLEEADRIGARYVLLDRLDGVSAFYLPPVIGGQPDAFCHIGGWSEGGAEIGTELFGILPASERGLAQDIRVCPEPYGSWPGEDPPSYRGEIPRLAQGVPGPDPASP